ncbi:hypothetical protein [Spirillospora sp. NPDC048823]|uniref:hypothetical protein n=1 Tax=unclassified Spirillospora TaxID=2642701 RepID=UPI00371325F0
MSGNDDDHKSEIILVLVGVIIVLLLVMCDTGDRQRMPSDIEGPDTCYGRGGLNTC